MMEYFNEAYEDDDFEEILQILDDADAERWI